MRALLALLVACSAPALEERPAPAPILLSCEAGIPCAEAAAEWNAALGRTAFALGEGGYRVAYADGTEPCDGVAAWRGCARKDRVDLWKPAFVGVLNVKEENVLLHELGHVLGLSHDSAGLMNPARDATRTCIDSRAAAAAGGVSTCDH